MGRYYNGYDAWTSNTSTAYTFNVKDWYVTTTGANPVPCPSVPEARESESDNVRWLRKRVDEMREQAFAA